MRILIVFVMGLLLLPGCAVVHVRQNAQYDSSSAGQTSTAESIQTIADSSDQSVSQAPASDSWQTLAEKSVQWKGTTAVFTQSCKGNVRTVSTEGAPVRPATYCIGLNQLSYVQETGEKPKVLQMENVPDAKRAPLLMNVMLIPNTQKGAVLISYAPDPCSTSNDCGIGLPSNYVTYAVNLLDGEEFVIRNFPRDGIPSWSPDGTKAFFVHSTCGGAGCTSAPITGYDLQSDTAKDLTTEQASDYQDVTDSQGHQQPYWKKVEWTARDIVSATIQYPDGKERTLAVRF